MQRGDRVAQLVLERISMMPCQEVEDLDATERGAGGFGSTGVSASPKRQRVMAPGGPARPCQNLRSWQLGTVVSIQILSDLGLWGGSKKWWFVWTPI